MFEDTPHMDTTNAKGADSAHVIFRNWPYFLLVRLMIMSW